MVRSLHSRSLAIEPSMEMKWPAPCLAQSPYFCLLLDSQSQFLMACASPSGPMPKSLTSVLPHMAQTEPLCAWHLGSVATGAVHVVCSLHRRSVVCVLGVDTHCVWVHVVRAVQTRSLLTVAAVGSNCELKLQTGVAMVHTSPLAVFEKLEPAVQGAHWRSVVAVPSTDLPEPMGHVAQLAHVSVASVLMLMNGLKVP